MELIFEVLLIDLLLLLLLLLVALSLLAAAGGGTIAVEFLGVVARAAGAGALGRILGSPGLGVAHVELLERRQTLFEVLEGRRRQLRAVQV